MQDEDSNIPLIVKRRVQVTGGSTYIVSLPKEWAKILNITKGSEVLLELNPERWVRLRVEPTNGAQIVRAIEIPVRPNLSSAALSMQIISTYLAGYDTITLRYEPSESSLAEDVVNFVRTKTIGLELLEESDDQLVLRTVVDVTSISAKTAIGNMVKIVKSMIEDLSDVIEEIKQKDLLEAVIRRDDIVDKLYLYIYKQLNLALQGIISPKELEMNTLAESINIYTMVKSLERIADQVVSMSQWLLDYNGALTVELKALFAKVRDVTVRSIDLVSSSDQGLLLDMYERLHNVANEVTELYSRARMSGCANECYPIFDGARRIIAQTIDLLEALMGLYMLRKLESALAHEDIKKA